MKNSFTGKEISKFYKKTSNTDSYNMDVDNYIKNKNFIKTDIIIEDIIRSDKNLESYLNSFMSNKNYLNYDLENINNKPIILDKKNGVLDGYIRIALNYLTGQSTIISYKEKSINISISNYKQNNFLTLKYDIYTYYLENISPYIKKRLEENIKYKNYREIIKIIEKHRITQNK